LVAGREFSDGDREGAAPVAIVNEAFARRYFGGGSAVGRRVRFSRESPWKEVVGEVRNTAWMDAREKAFPFVFLPTAQQPNFRSLTFFVRARPGAHPTADIRRVVRQLDPNVPITGLMEYSVKVADAVYVQRLLAILASVFGGLATLLAALGLYGLIAWTFAQRTAEIGIRLALGASPRNVTAMVARDVGLLALSGIVPGVLLAFAAAAWMRTQLFGVSAHDPVIFAGAALALLAVAALAAVMPASKAARIAPAEALRYQ